MASEQAIRALQNALPPSLTKRLDPVELENVEPALLLMPHASAGIPSAITGKDIDLGSRVVFVGASGGPPLGSKGTVVGVHSDDFEVLFDAAFPGGTDLQGRRVPPAPTRSTHIVHIAIIGLAVQIFYHLLHYITCRNSP